MLGLLDGDAGVAAQALAKLGLDEDAIAAALPPPPRTRRGVPQISSEVHRAFEQSLAEALRLECDRIEPEHLLLALLRNPGGLANRIVVTAGADRERVDSKLETPRRTVRPPA